MYLARTCAYPARPTNGDVHCTTPPGDVPVYGESCTYSCDIGHEPIGMVEQQCLETENWEADPVVCRSTWRTSLFICKAIQS